MQAWHPIQKNSLVYSIEILTGLFSFLLVSVKQDSLFE